MSKYHARKTVVDGIEFDSAKEAARYRQLKALQAAGKISGLELQKRYELIPPQYESYPRYGKGGKQLKDGVRCLEKAMYYVADFVYYDEDKRLVVEDVKGCKVGAAYQMFAVKRKLMLYMLGIKIQEI